VALSSMNDEKNRQSLKAIGAGDEALRPVLSATASDAVGNRDPRAVSYPVNEEKKLEKKECARERGAGEKREKLWTEPIHTTSHKKGGPGPTANYGFCWCWHPQ